MIEVEVKLPVENLDSIKGKLLKKALKRLRVLKKEIHILTIVREK